MILTKKTGRKRRGIYIECLVCKTRFYVRPSLKEKRKYCSKKCQPPSKKKIERIKKNCPVCTKEIMVLPNCAHRKKYCSRACSAKERFTGEKNIKWKGEDVGYYSLHNWLKRNYGKPTICEREGCSGKSKKYCWGNISGEYKRDRNDWYQVCTSCNQLDSVHMAARFNLFIQKDIDKK